MSSHAALGLTSDEVEQTIRLAGAAPSMCNAQPWRFRVASDVIEVHADEARRFPHTDPDDRELRIGCGAALFNLRLALEHLRARPWVTLMARPREPSLLAVVRRQGVLSSAEENTRLFQAISKRRTNRWPFLSIPVPDSHRYALVAAAEAEHATLQVVDRSWRGKLVELVHRAHAAQMADEGVRAEQERWTGLGLGVSEGVPAASAGPQPEGQDEWVLRDYSGGQAKARVPGKDFEDDPLMAVLCSYQDSRVAQLEAGQALQRLLLTATSLGLAASLISQVIEVADVRRELQEVCGQLGGQLWPQALVRIGYGSHVPATPRRAVRELFLEDDETELELGSQGTA